MSVYKFSSDWIKKIESEHHWRLYWHQQKLMENNLDKKFRIAEIGVGSKFTYNYLASKGYFITSIDIDKNKDPDIHENIVTCSDDLIEFDTIIAFNIFEHIPYLDFLKTIEKFKRRRVQQLFIGLPIYRKIIFEIYILISRYFKKELILSVPKRKIKTENHHWELGYKNYTHNNLIYDLDGLGYKLKNHFKFRLQSYYYFSLADEI